MLEETYERSYNHNYMILKAKEREYPGFCERIVQENEIPGLLSCQFRILEGNLFFYYEISGKRTLSQLFQKKKIGGMEMRRLLVGLSMLQRESQRYLLDFRKYILLPEYLYSDFDIKQLYAVYHPDYEGGETLEEIGSFFIEHVDYQEAEAVELAYSFQQRIMEENVNLELVVEGLLREKKTEVVSETIFCERKEEGNDICTTKVEEKLSYGMREQSIREEAVYHAVPSKEKWKIGELACIQELQNFLKGLFIFKEKENGHKRKKEKEEINYEVELDLDEEKTEVPFFSQSMVSEETQFFSSGEEVGIHSLIYQGREKLPDLKLEVFPYIIGKSEKGIDGRLELPTISRIHSQLDYINDSYFITDLNSTNGTFLNGERLPPNIRKTLSVGDRIQFAGEVYVFQ